MSAQRRSKRKNRTVKLLDIPPNAMQNSQQQMTQKRNEQIYTEVGNFQKTQNFFMEEYVPMDFDIIARGKLASISFINGNVIVKFQNNSE